MSSNKWLLPCAALAAGMALSVGSASAGTIILMGPQSGTLDLAAGGSELFAWQTPKPFDWTFTIGPQGGLMSSFSGPYGPGSTKIGSTDYYSVEATAPRDTPIVVDFSLVTSAVPESAAWLMMVLGVGLLGAGLRMRGREDERLAQEV